MGKFKPRMLPFPDEYRDSIELFDSAEAIKPISNAICEYVTSLKHTSVNVEMFIHSEQVINDIRLRYRTSTWRRRLLIRCIIRLLTAIDNAKYKHAINAYEQFLLHQCNTTQDPYDFPDDMTFQLCQHLTVKSVLNYRNHIKKLLQNIGIDHFDIQVFRDSTTILNYIRSLDQYSVKHTYLSNIKSILKHTGHIDILKLYESTDDIATKKQAVQDYYINDFHGPFITFDQIEEKRDNLLKQSPITFEIYMQWYILNLYTRIPPLRLNEYLRMKITDEHIISGREFCEKQGFNYLSLSDGAIYSAFNKTNKYREFPVSGEIVSLIASRDDIFPELEKNEFVIPSRNPKRLISDKEVTKYITDVLGNHVTTRLLRNIYVMDRLTKLSKEDRIQAAYIMGHSLETQTMIYNKRII